MAAVTLLGSATFNTSSGSKTVTATPAANDLIVIIAAHSGNSSAATPTDDQGGTYTAIANAVKASSADRLGLFVRNSPIPAAISTVFTHAPGTSTGGGLAVLKVTGMTRSGSSAVRQSAKQDNQAAATPAPVFGSAPLTGNPVIGVLFNATNPATMTPRTNFTERADAGYNSPATGLEVMSRDSGETATTQTWGSASASAFCSLVVELDSSLAPISGALAKTLGAITGSAAAAVRLAGTLSRTLGGLVGAAASMLQVRGQTSATLGELTGSAAAKMVVRGQGAPAFGALSSSSAAKLSLAAAVSRALGGLSSGSAATLRIVGSAARSLGSMTSTGLAALGIRGAAAAALGGLTVTSQGTSQAGGEAPPSNGVGIGIGIGL